MILNYRVELCRQCYFKRVRQCTHSDNYIHNYKSSLTLPGGECVSYTPVPWLPLV